MFPERPDIQRFLGDLALEAGDLEVAEQAYRATLVVRPDWSTFADLTGILLRAHRYGEAEEVVARAVAVKDDAYRRAWLGMVYAVAGKHDLAEGEFRKAIAVSPDYAYAHYRFAQFCVARGRLDEATAELKTLLRLEPTSSAFSLLCDILLKKGRFNEAEEVILNAIAAREDEYRRTRLGMVYVASGKYDLAEEQYLKAIAMQPDYEYAHYRLGQLYAAIGRRDDAIAEFETVMRLVEPDSSRAKSVKAELERIPVSGSSSQQVLPGFDVQER